MLCNVAPLVVESPEVRERWAALKPRYDLARKRLVAFQPISLAQQRDLREKNPASTRRYNLRSVARTEMPSAATSSVCAYLGNLLAFGSALKSLDFAAIMLRASTRGQAGSQWRPLPLQMRRA